MGHRLSKIYTRTGDKGETGLGDGSRVGKDSERIAALGDVDELNSSIGVLLAELPAGASAPAPEGAAGASLQIRAALENVQHDLFDLGGELCIPGHRMIDAAHVERLEKELDEFNEALPPLKEFILPGGGPATSACHVARSFSCGRACCIVASNCRVTAAKSPLSNWFTNVFAIVVRLSALVSCFA